MSTPKHPTDVEVQDPIHVNGHTLVKKERIPTWKPGGVWWTCEDCGRTVRGDSKVEITFGAFRCQDPIPTTPEAMRDD